jgi:hypothetical protein
MENTNKNKVILDFVIIEYGDNNIMRFEFTRDVVITMDLTMQMFDVCKTLCPDKLYKSLKIVTHKFKLENDVLDFFASEYRKSIITEDAIVLASPALRIFGNFYLRIKKPVLKTKIFDTEKEAVTWLLQQ